MISIVRYLAAQLVTKDTKPLDIAMSIAQGEPFQPLTYLDSICTSFSLLAASSWASSLESKKGRSTLVLDDIVVVEKPAKGESKLATRKRIKAPISTLIKR